MIRKMKSLLLLLLTIAMMPVFVPFVRTSAASGIDSLKNTPPQVSADGTYLILPALDGARIELYGSSNKQVISLDGKIHKPLVDTKVELMYKAVMNSGEEVPGDYNVQIIIEIGRASCRERV